MKQVVEACSLSRIDVYGLYALLFSVMTGLIFIHRFGQMDAAERVLAITAARQLNCVLTPQTLNACHKEILASTDNA